LLVFSSLYLITPNVWLSLRFAWLLLPYITEVILVSTDIWLYTSGEGKHPHLVGSDAISVAEIYQSCPGTSCLCFQGTRTKYHSHLESLRTRPSMTLQSILGPGFPQMTIPFFSGFLGSVICPSERSAPIMFLVFSLVL
jgi:hypothetical protein